jgi:uncharacterized coiled-coil DUF342 family protein
MSEQ